MNRLDESLRDRLGQAADDADLLAADAPDVANLMRQQGPALVKSGRRRYAAQRVGLGLLIVGVPAALAVSTLSTPSPNATKLTCLSHNVAPETGAVQGVRDLGYAAFEVEKGSQLSVDTVEACKTVLALKRGAVLVHARDLGGGELVVATPRGRVTVKGTLFKVVAEAARWSVDVAEGQVAVETDGHVTLVNKNERWEAEGGVNTLGVEQQDALHNRVRAWTTVATAEAAPAEVMPSVDETHEGNEENEAHGEDEHETGPAPRSVRSTNERRPKRRPVATKKRRSRTKRRPPTAPAAPGDYATKTAEAAAEDAPPEIPRATPPRQKETDAVQESEAVKTPSPTLTAEQRVARAEAAWKLGDLSRARALYKDVGRGRGATAEGAWVRLARLELNDGRLARAAEALDQRRRFGRGFFGAEAAWLRVQIAEKQNNPSAAAEAARSLVQHYEDTPQGAAAKRWLKQNTSLR